MTIDSFARQIWHRWRTLAASLNIEIGDFNQTCDACGQLLEQPQVAKWVARSYPVVVVDEAQELAAPRLRIVKALTEHCIVIVAADEFQCLDEELDTSPFMDWFNTGEITQLEHIHRTNVAGLLTAGSNLRQLIAPSNGPGLRISAEFPNNAPFIVGGAIAGAQGSIAVLFPPGGAGWSTLIKDRLALGLYSAKYNIPPITLTYEPKAADETAAIMANFVGVEDLPNHMVYTRLNEIADPPRWLPQIVAAVRLSADRQGKSVWSEAEIRAVIERKAASYRAFVNDRPRGIPLLGIHQAKNRQFDHVIILWPHGVPGGAEQRARLLYNGITRARRTCKVFARSAALLNDTPFTFPAA